MCVFLRVFVPAGFVFPHACEQCIYSKPEEKEDGMWLCVFLSARARGGRKEGSALIFKSSRCVPRIKYLGRRSLDLHVLAETPGSHWFLTTQLGRHYNKMHYSQLHIPSDTLVRLTLPPANLHWPLCMCCVYPLRWSQLKVFLHSLPGRLLPGLLTSESKCW